MSTGIFNGIKVADFSWVAVVPLSIRYLADHGATVIKIESRKRPDILRSFPPFKDNIQDADHNAFFPNYNCNKLGITLNLDAPKGKEIAKRIISWADIIAESYVPGVMQRWGLSYQDIIKFKPDIIMLSANMQGQTGPHRMLSGYGAQLASLSGITALIGWPDRTPAVPYGAYTDFIAPKFNVLSIIAALIHRQRTGEGQYLDLSQYEAGIQFLAPAILDYQANGRDIIRKGNRDSFAVPHGVFPTKDPDRWIAIAVANNDEWQRLCQLIGDTVLIYGSRFSTIIERKNNESELEAIISRWTMNFTAEQLMTLMQENSIASGIVHNAAGIHSDPQLKHRGHFWELEHAVIGKHTYDGHCFHFSKTTSQPEMAAPCLGQHNEHVYTKILGFSDDEFVQLMAEGVID